MDMFVNLLKDNLEVLQSLKDTEEKTDEYFEKIDDIQNRMELYASEMEFELDRLETLPGGEDYVKSVREEFMITFRPHVEKIQTLLEELRG